MSLSAGNDAPVQPGEVLVASDSIELFAGRTTLVVDVLNTGDRPVQVGSHFHFAEANEALRFERGATVGFRLAVPAGTSVRFEPGVAASVRLVEFGGDRYMAGFRGLYGGAT